MNHRVECRLLTGKHSTLNTLFSHKLKDEDIIRNVFGTQWCDTELEVKLKEWWDECNVMMSLIMFLAGQLLPSADVKD